ncbi:MAG: glycosyltransferase family 4 protein [Gammaproteobacteria bacterium]|nr:glycosyltransferase family 4 protein [Gammaproteobacteria bacterium]
MKILYHHRLGSKDGQYVHVEELTNALQALKHELLFVSPSVIQEKEFGGESTLVRMLKSKMPQAIYEIAEFFYSLPVYLKLARAIKAFKPDIIYERYNLFLPAGIWIKKRFKVPLILEVNAPLYSERKKNNGIALDWLAKWSERYVWRNADCVIAVTEVLKNYIVEAGADPEKIQVIPNGVDLDCFDAAQDRVSSKKKLELENKLVLGFVGFVRKWHGLDRVVELIAEDTRNDPFLLVVGDGPAREDIESAAKRLKVEERIHMAGVVSREEMPFYVAAFDIALQPDVVPYASPLKLFEYMAMGCAIVAPDSGNIKEILTHELDALLFDYQKPETFGVAIKRLIEDEELRTRLGQGARMTLERRNLTWRHNAEVTVEIAKGLLNGF